MSQCSILRSGTQARASCQRRLVLRGHERLRPGPMPRAKNSSAMPSSRVQASVFMFMAQQHGCWNRRSLTASHCARWKKKRGTEHMSSIIMAEYQTLTKENVPGTHLKALPSTPEEKILPDLSAPKAAERLPLRRALRSSSLPAARASAQTREQTWRKS